jgi:hypothetical protein
MSQKKTLSQETSGKAGAFLFDMPSDESKALDMRTRINSPASMNAILYYGILAYNLECKSAREIKDLMERLFIASKEGMGRVEAVQTLKQNLPKRVEIDKGTDLTEFT